MPAARRPLDLPLAGQRQERANAAANRVRIMEATRRLVSERGADRVSMDDVAAAAGVGKGTIFRRFGDRAGLLEATIGDEMQRFQDAFLNGPPPLGPGPEPSVRLEAFLVELVDVQRRHMPLVLAAGLGARRADPLYAALRLHVRTLVEAIDPTLEADVLAAMLLGAIAPPVLEVLPSSDPGDAEAVVASVRTLLHGIVPTAGP